MVLCKRSLISRVCKTELVTTTYNNQITAERTVVTACFVNYFQLMKGKKTVQTSAKEFFHCDISNNLLVIGMYLSVFHRTNYVNGKRNKYMVGIKNNTSTKRK